MITEQETEFIESVRNAYPIDKATTKRLEHIYVRETLDLISNGCFCSETARMDFKNKFFAWYNNR